MNKRQKKKLYKNTLIKIKKLHPKAGDVICLQPNFEEVDLWTIAQFYNKYHEMNVFGEANSIILPCPMKSVDKDIMMQLLKKAMEIIGE